MSTTTYPAGFAKEVARLRVIDEILDAEEAGRISSAVAKAILGKFDAYCLMQ